MGTWLAEIRRWRLRRAYRKLMQLEDERDMFEKAGYPVHRMVTEGEIVMTQERIDRLERGL